MHDPDLELGLILAGKSLRPGMKSHVKRTLRIKRLPNVMPTGWEQVVVSQKK